MTGPWRQGFDRAPRELLETGIRNCKIFTHEIGHHESENILTRVCRLVQVFVEIREAQ